MRVGTSIFCYLLCARSVLGILCTVPDLTLTTTLQSLKKSYNYSYCMDVDTVILLKIMGKRIRKNQRKDAEKKVWGLQKCILLNQYPIPSFAHRREMHSPFLLKPSPQSPSLDPLRRYITPIRDSFELNIYSLKDQAFQLFIIQYEFLKTAYYQLGYGIYNYLFAYLFMGSRNRREKN